VALRAHLLHGARYRSLALVEVVALAPWGSDFFRVVAGNAPVFAQIPPPLHEALLRAYITGAAHRPLSGEHLDMLAPPGSAPTARLPSTARSRRPASAIPTRSNPCTRPSSCRC
jgi:hypothetical protein